MEKPRTLLDAIVYFADVNVASDFVAQLRWPDGAVCESCGSVEVTRLSTRPIWKCKGCKRQFSVKVGTIFEDSPLSLSKWLPAVWLIANSKNGVSSHELGRALGVTQKSAWFMLHRIRLAMQTGSFDKIDTIAEADETYIGGIARNMHAADRKAKVKGGGPSGHMTGVAGILERGGKVRAQVISDTTLATLQGFVRAHVTPAAQIFTDAHRSYVGLRDTHSHGVVDHSLGQYVDGIVHTNGIENFWMLLKRSIKGTYVSVAPAHLLAYVDERVFSFNNAKASDFDRFALALNRVANRRLTYSDLTGKA